MTKDEQSIDPTKYSELGLMMMLKSGHLSYAEWQYEIRRRVAQGIPVLPYNAASAELSCNCLGCTQ